MFYFWVAMLLFIIIDKKKLIILNFYKFLYFRKLNIHIYI